MVRLTLRATTTAAAGDGICANSETGLGNLDAFEASLAPMLASHPSPFSLDLSALDHIRPATLVLLITALRHRAVEYPSADFEYSPPRENHLGRRLSSETLRALIAPSTGGQPAEHRDAVGFDGCEPFSSGEGVTRSAYALQASLRRRVALPEEKLGSIGSLLTALAGNVLRHGTRRGGTAAVEITGDERALEIEIAVADRGVGIRRSLARNPDHRDLPNDTAAIERALQPGVSGDPRPSGGIGLFMARKVIERNGGTLMIRSGSGLITHPSPGQPSASSVSVRGTLVVACVRLDAPFDYQAVDDEAAEPGGLMG
jgi:anti-sigma regulatory factor (Ser/Thr protein kinase)